MNYISFIFVSYLLCATNSFDMKYSLQKHKWNQFIPSLITSGNIDKHRTIIYYANEPKVSLKSTELEGGVTLSDSYILAANFKIIKADSTSCLFSMERKGVRKLALCLQPTGGDAVTVTLDSANIPDGKLEFGYKIKKNELTQLLLSVNKTHVTEIVNCDVKEEKRLHENISNLIRLTDDMDLTLPTGSNLDIQIRDLDLYSPVDVTTVTSLCENITPGLEGLMGPPGIGIKGDAGPRGEKGERGEPGLPAPQAPCPATFTSPATAELDTLKSILGEIKSIFNDFIVEKKEQMKYFADVNTRCTERLTNAEKNILINSNNIDALKNAMLNEAQL